ncbi:MAG: hypothetical protein ACQ5SW_04915, partial [Sphaerochaetaceae bacterium]
MIFGYKRLLPGLSGASFHGPCNNNCSRGQRIIRLTIRREMRGRRGRRDRPRNGRTRSKGSIEKETVLHMGLQEHEKLCVFRFLANER